jgi:signal peptidase I
MTRWRDYVTTLVLAVVCALFVRSYVATAYKVPTGSMQPTLKPGDFILASRMSYGMAVPFMRTKMDLSVPERGDLVVFSYPNQPTISYVKRVVGLPGDRVQIQKGRLILNDVPLVYEKLENASKDNPNEEMFDVFSEKSEQAQWRVIMERKGADKNFGPLIVPPGEVFLLGDNRDASDDSRYWGTVPLSEVGGKVLIVWLSLDWQNKWGEGRYPSVRWDRVFSSLR